MEASSSPSTPNPLAEPFRSTRPPTSNPSSATDPAHEQLFRGLSTYPFQQDAEFQSGLSTLLGHPETPAAPEEVEQNADLVLKAQCFYFSRQNNLPSPLDPASYKSWLRLRDQQPGAETPSPSLSDTDNMPSPVLPPPPPPTQSTTPLPSDPPPPEPKYPTTFSHIVDLITRNQPIPGIETIPDIVLGTELSAPNTVPARKKPWESATATAPPEEASREGQEASASERPLFGGLLGPLKKMERGDSSDLKPIPVETKTPSWQELVEKDATGQAARGGDSPVAHAT